MRKLGRSSRSALCALLLLAVAGCSAAAPGDAEEIGRSAPPAPDSVAPPTGVTAVVEERLQSEPDAEGTSVEVDAEELRAAWVTDRLAAAGGHVGRDPETGRLLHRYTAIVVRWDEPAFAEANAFFLEADGRSVAAFDTNDEFGVHGVEPVPHDMSFEIDRADLERAGADATWTLTAGWAPHGWYLDDASEAAVLRAAPLRLELPRLDT